MRYRSAVSVLALLALPAACADDTLSPDAPPGPDQGLIDIRGQYIVRLHDDVLNVAGVAQEITETHGAELLYVYRHVIKGFALRLPTFGPPATLESHPAVRYIEPDAMVRAAADTSGIQEQSVTWGLDRVDQRGSVLDARYGWVTPGSSAHVYIIDSGIREDHEELEDSAGVTRIGWSYDFVEEDSTVIDCSGHGTHAAGIVGGLTYGVAKEVQLHSIRILDCDNKGTVSRAIAGLDTVSAEAPSRSVALMAWVTIASGGQTAALTEAADNLADNGVVVVVAAGNNGDPACDYAPADVEATGTLVVGATNSDDDRWSSSNYGSCLELFAPGVSIESAGHTSSTASSIKTGTSVAAAFVAGTAAKYRHRYPSHGPTRVADSVATWATTGAVGNPGKGSPNRLVWSYVVPLYSHDLDGPSSITEEGQYSWHSNPEGGDDEFTYDWETSQDGESWFSRGSDSTHTQWVDSGNNPGFYIRYAVTSVTMAEVSDTVWVAVDVECTGPFCVDDPPPVSTPVP